MSINMSDEYLDELLDAIEPIIAPEPEVPVVEEVPVVSAVEEPEVVESIATDIGIGDDISIMDLFAGEEATPEDAGSQTGMESAAYEEISEDDAAIGDLLASLSSEDADSSGMMLEDDINALLNAASSAAESSADYNDEDRDADVKELLKQFTDDEDLSDIQDILDKNDNMEAVDESILETPEVEVFQVDESAAEGLEADTEKNNKKGVFSFLKKKDKEEKKEKKEKKKKEKKNKKAKEAEAAQEEAGIVENSIDQPENTSEPVELEIGMEELVNVDGMSDIDQLLSGGAFFAADEAVEQIEQEVEDTSNGSKKDASKKKAAKKKEKKESLFSKVFTMLTEEVEEDAVPEVNATGITDENRNILEELSKEDKKKAKKEKKKDKKKGKNAKNQKDGEDGSEDEVKDKKDKKPKKEKKKREKKEKPRKVEEITKPEKKLPRKSVISIFVLCFSVLAAILIMQTVVSKTTNLQEAEWAFDNADYETCYSNLHMVERDEEEEALFQKSSIILAVQRKLDSYNNFMMMGLEVEALNSLLEGVLVYREQTEAANEWGVSNQITAIYEAICEKLNNIYGLSDEDVEEILGYESKVTYTKRLDSIVNGTPFVIEEPIYEEEAVVEEAQPLVDVLPQEEDFLPEDTREVSAQSEAEAMPVEDVPVVSTPVSQGETVVVGSAPVDISGTGATVTGGQNVGSGNTNVSVELNNGNAVVSGF